MPEASSPTGTNAPKDCSAGAAPTSSGSLRTRSFRLATTAATSSINRPSSPEKDGQDRAVTFARSTAPNDEPAWSEDLGDVRAGAILDQIEDACAVVDLAGRYRFVNDAFCRLFGRTKQALIGTSYRDNSTSDD